MHLYLHCLVFKYIVESLSYIHAWADSILQIQFSIGPAGIFCRFIRAGVLANLAACRPIATATAQILCEGAQAAGD